MSRTISAKIFRWLVDRRSLEIWKIDEIVSLDAIKFTKFVYIVFTKSLATSIGFTSLISNLNLIVFDLFSIEHSTNEPCCTLNINNFGIRSDDLFERRTFVSPDTVLFGATAGFCVAATVSDDVTAADVMAVVDDVVCAETASVGRFCSGPEMD